MENVFWIKLSTRIIADEKLKLIEDDHGLIYFALWIKLLVLAGVSNNDGLIHRSKGVPYTVRELSKVAGCDEGTMDTALSIFSEYAMIHQNGMGVEILNWKKHQSSAQERAATAARVRKHRERHKSEDAPAKEAEPEKKTRRKGPWKRCGSGENVVLTEDEYKKLVDKFSQAQADDRIEGLSLYKGSTGKKYDNDYLTILNWDRKQKKNDPGGSRLEVLK